MLTESEFAEARQKILRAWHRGDNDRAFAEIRRVLEVGGRSKMKGECLLYQGMIRQGGDALAEARRSWTEALRWADEGTFLRFQLEQSIGESWEQEGRAEEALEWYWRALRTCSGGEEFSGHQALVACIKLRSREIERKDKRLLFTSVLVKSWRVLDMPGEPNIEDLPSAVTELAVTISDQVETILKESR